MLISQSTRIDSQVYLSAVDPDRQAGMLVGQPILMDRPVC